MSEGPSIGDWTQYGWISDDVSCFPARIRLRNAAWMVYYEPDAVVQRERAERLELCDENAKLRELCADLYAEMLTYSKAPTYNASTWATRLRELGIEVVDA